MMKIAIVGSGLSGLACADQLVAAGHSVRLFDKARGPGGRMSTRRIDTAAGQVGFDHGAQYFTARDPAFRQQVDQWQDSGASARWPAAGPEAWVGVPIMNAPVKALAVGQTPRALGNHAASDATGQAPELAESRQASLRHRAVALFPATVRHIFTIPGCPVCP